MGVAPPPAAGRISSNPPWIHAGNLDNKELVAGTTLFIPVHAPGALFEVGDGHAAQGDGEVDQTAIETSLRGRLQLIVRKGMTLDVAARGDAAPHYISMGTDEDLTKATRIAIQEMIDFLVATQEARQARRPISWPASPPTSRSRSWSTARSASTSRSRRASSSPQVSAGRRAFVGHDIRIARSILLEDTAPMRLRQLVSPSSCSHPSRVAPAHRPRQHRR